jgi:hypothetical protein
VQFFAAHEDLVVDSVRAGWGPPPAERGRRLLDDSGAGAGPGSLTGLEAVAQLETTDLEVTPRGPEPELQGTGSRELEPPESTAGDLSKDLGFQPMPRAP